jgi:predicted ArsR family transcriptional regulator
VPDVAHIDDAVKAYAKSDEWSGKGDTALKAAYLNDGLSLRQIALRLGISPEAVRLRLQGLGVTLRGRGGRH